MKVILAFILVAVLIAGCGGDDGFVQEDTTGVLYRLRKLNEDGTVWYIYADDPTNWINRTCITVDLKVIDVILANDASTEATVKCE